MPDSVLELHDVSYWIGRPNRRPRHLLDQVNVRVVRGESVAIVGPSGVGKSTLLALCLGLIRPQSGQICLAGKSISELRGRAVARLRSQHVGMVFQGGELLDELSPLENVSLPATLAGVRVATARERAERLLTSLKLDVADVPTSGLSGGERQRVALARALVNEPDVLLADEPTGMLDKATRDVVAAELYLSPTRWNCALVVVTHDPSVSGRADRVLQLGDARLSPLEPRSGSLAGDV